MGITKTEVKDIFGGTLQNVATAIGITRQGVCQWPESLTQEQQDRSIGAAVRLELSIDKKLMKKFIKHSAKKASAA